MHLYSTHVQFFRSLHFTDTPNPINARRVVDEKPGCKPGVSESSPRCGHAPRQPEMYSPLLFDDRPRLSGYRASLRPSPGSDRSAGLDDQYVTCGGNHRLPRRRSRDGRARWPTPCSKRPICIVFPSVPIDGQSHFFVLLKAAIQLRSHIWTEKFSNDCSRRMRACDTALNCQMA